jgi:hypothetical protein
MSRGPIRVWRYNNLLMLAATMGYDIEGATQRY